MGVVKSRKKSVVNGEVDRLADIYRIAATVIHEKGFDATSMNDIALAVGMTKAGIYHYVAGKKELLYAIMSYAMDLLETKVIAPATAVTDPEKRLDSIINNHVQLITGSVNDFGDSHLTILTDELGGLTPAHRRKIIERKRAYMELVRDTLTQLKKSGKLKNIDPTVGTFSLFGMLMWLARWYRPDGRLSSKQVAAEIKKIVLGGLLVAPKL